MIITFQISIAEQELESLGEYYQEALDDLKKAVLKEQEDELKKTKFACRTTEKVKQINRNKKYVKNNA